MLPALVISNSQEFELHRLEACCANPPPPASVSLRRRAHNYYSHTPLTCLPLFSFSKTMQLSASATTRSTARANAGQRTTASFNPDAANQQSQVEWAAPPSSSRSSAGILANLNKSDHAALQISSDESSGPRPSTVPVAVRPRPSPVPVATPVPTLPLGEGAPSALRARLIGTGKANLLCSAEERQFRAANEFPTPPLKRAKTSTTLVRVDTPRPAPSTLLGYFS